MQRIFAVSVYSCLEGYNKIYKINLSYIKERRKSSLYNPTSRYVVVLVMHRLNMCVSRLSYLMSRHRSPDEDLVQISTQFRSVRNIETFLLRFNLLFRYINSRENIEVDEICHLSDKYLPCLGAGTSLERGRLLQVLFYACDETGMPCNPE